MPGAKRQWNECGQSLLEVTVSLGIAVLVISALSIVSISGLKNSEFSQNQTTATKLAQDWIEQVRTIRDRNGTVCDPGSTYYPQWLSLWNTTCGSSNPDCYYFSVNENQAPSCQGLTPTIPSLTALTGTTHTTPDATYPQFSKQITIVDCGTNNGTCGSNLLDDMTQKLVTVTVSWADSSGSHQSQLATILTKQ